MKKSKALTLTLVIMLCAYWWITPQPSFAAGEPAAPLYEIKGLTINGNTVFGDKELARASGFHAGKIGSIEELRRYANSITLFYRDRGYPFAQAYIPAQSADNGIFVVEVIEGRYGTIRVEGEREISGWAKQFLWRLRPGDVIRSALLEKSLLILEDQPGLRVERIIRPGEQDGEGDLVVRVWEKPEPSFDLTIDNYGGRFSGEYRGQATINASGVLSTGDNIRVRALDTNEGMWLGQAEYSFAIGFSGLRGHLGYARTVYDLCRPYEGYTGVARDFEARLGYPFVRSCDRNISVFLGFRRREIDNKLLGASYEEKSMNIWTAAVHFDARDSIGGSGISWGNFSLSSGEPNPVNPEGSRENFLKWAWSLNRLQRLTSGFWLFAFASGQWSDTELDSSECFTLGGAEGVRAYPRGEASGSNGWLAETELQYRASNGLQPYLFYDAGHVSGNAGEENRSIGGAGAGVRFQTSVWNMDICAAWPIHGGASTSDQDGPVPRVWFKASYRF